MTFFLLLWFGVFAGTAPPIDSDRFYSYVLNDFDRHSAFVALDVISDEYSGPVIIENAELYRFLNQTKGLSKATYRTSMTHLLKTKGKLKIPKQSLDKWGFLKVSQSDSVLKAVEQGKDSFVDRYFTGRVLKPEIGEIDRRTIISALFGWRIPAVVNDETGYLVIIELSKLR